MEAVVPPFQVVLQRTFAHGRSLFLFLMLGKAKESGVCWLHGTAYGISADCSRHHSWHG